MSKKSNPLYMRHYFMMRRCYDPTYSGYKNAGARGLTVCRRWHSLELFTQDILARWGAPPGHRSQLARLDPFKGWTPSNIAGWQDLQFTANHRVNNKLVTYQGKTKTNAEWARELGMKGSTLWTRHRRGYTVTQAFSKPVNQGIKLK